MTKRISYIDEYGTPALNIANESVTTFFMVTAIIVDEKDVQEVDAAVQRIRDKYRGGAELKSNAIGKDDDRRLRILKDLSALPFSIFSVAVDKREIIPTSGLIYKQPFLKYINSQLYRKLFKAFTSLEIFADEHGSDKFQNSFKDYLYKNHLHDMFNKCKVHFRNSADVNIIQLADFIGGTIARKIDPKKHTERANELINVFKDKIISIDFWPPYISFKNTATKFDDESGYDYLIEQYCSKQAYQFIDENSSKDDDDTILQVETVKYLLYHASILDDNTYITTNAVLEHLNVINATPINEHMMRTKIIAKLRDSEVIIASSQSGIKLPTCLRNILDHFDQAVSIIQPLADRIIKASKQLKLMTNNKLNLFEDKKYMIFERLDDQIEP